jgi:hypothetical protein
MLKTVSSIANAIGALNYKGTWDANANSPALTSSVGTKGDYYVVSTAGSTNLNGISNWGIGDWAAFNGSVWQRVEGGADLNGVNLSVSGTSTLSGLTASTALALDASKNVVSVTNTGNGNNVLASSPSIATPTLTGDVSLTTGNIVVGTDGKGIDFSVAAGPGATSSLLNDYEQGTHVPTVTTSISGTISLYANWDTLSYTKVGRLVTIQGALIVQSVSSPTGAVRITLPYTCANLNDGSGSGSCSVIGNNMVSANASDLFGVTQETISYLELWVGNAAGWQNAAPQMQANTELWISFSYFTS